MRKTIAIFIVLLLGGLPAAVRASPASASFTRWQSGLIGLLGSDNHHVAVRALAEIAESGATMPTAEQAFAEDFLRALVRQSCRRDTGGLFRIFEPAMDERRTALFAALRRIQWSEGARGIVTDLLADMAANGAEYDSGMLRLEGFVQACRAQRVPRETLDDLLTGLSGASDDLLNGLYLAHRLYPRPADYWQPVFDGHFSGLSSAQPIAAAFASLDDEVWNTIRRTRNIYREALAAFFLQNTSVADWPAIDTELLLEMARAGRRPIADWEREMTAALAVLLSDVAADFDPGAGQAGSEPWETAEYSLPRKLRGCLDAFIKLHDRPETTFGSISPLLTENRQLFCYLHQPAGGVMDTLNKSSRNRAGSRRILINFMAPENESRRHVCLAGLTAAYYTHADDRRVQDELFARIVRPVIAARLEPGFDTARGADPVRSALTAAATVPDGFLAPRHRLVLAREFIEGLDWEAEIRLDNEILPNYRFTADILLAVAGMADDETARADGVNCARALAQWVDWMLQGGLSRPATLHFSVADAGAALREMCDAWGRIRRRFNLRRQELDMDVFFAGLTSELTEAADAIRRHGISDDPAGIERRERLIQAVRFTLTLSALIDDAGQLPRILAIIRDQLFDLPAPDDLALRVVPPDVLRNEVGIFRALDDDLAEALASLAAESGRASVGFQDMLREFALQYHADIQLGLLATDGFLAVLHGEDARLTAYRRYLQAGTHPCGFNSRQVYDSMTQLTRLLARTGFLNSEEALTELLGIYRARLDLSLWDNPLTFGMNENIGIPILIRLLQGEPLPLDLTARTGDGDDERNSTAARLLSVLEALQTGLEAAADWGLVRRVQYDARGRVVGREQYAMYEYLRRTDRLLRAWELLEFPVMTENTLLPAGDVTRALIRTAMADRPDGVIPVLSKPAGVTPRRRIDGTRRAALYRTARRHALTTEDIIAAAECAVMLPNDQSNTDDMRAISGYDALRADAFNRLRDALTANPNTDLLADALIAMLRLEAGRRGRGRSLPAQTLAGEFAAYLTDAGRQRVLIELWALQNRGAPAVDVASCHRHELPESDCRACRDAVARALDIRADELADMRRFCAGQAGVPVGDAPRDRWEAIGQLAAFMRRMDNVNDEIAAIGPDTVKTAWYLVSQARRAMQAIPPHWLPDWPAQLAPDEPLTAAVIRVARFITVSYGELMPIHGNITLDSLLGDDASRPANGDALAVFSVLDTEIKEFLLSAATLERRLGDRDARALGPVGALSPRELVAVHSVIQPALAVGVWKRGANAVRGGGTLIQFVAGDRHYDETWFDVDIVLEAGGSFTLSPRRLFDDAFQALDLLPATAESESDDAFVYNIWFGDMRQAVAGRGLAPTDLFNLDRFLCDAADILEDDRYDDRNMRAVRNFAVIFQRELAAWVEGSRGEGMGRMFSNAQTPMVLTAIAERIADRLGLYRAGHEPGILQPLEGRRRDAYAAFCRRCLFDTSAGRPVFPRAMRDILAARFTATAPDDPAAARALFCTLLEPFTISAGNGDENADDPVLIESAGLPDLYRRAMADSSAGPGYWFVGDFAHAYMQLVSEIYWHNQPDAPFSRPWRLMGTGRVYIDVPAPEDGLDALRLHTEAIRAGAEWRAACAERYADIPFIRRFFGFLPEMKTEPVEQ